MTLEELTLEGERIQLSEKDLVTKNGDPITLRNAERAIYDDVLCVRRNLARMDEAQRARFKANLAKRWLRARRVARLLFWAWVKQDEPVLEEDVEGRQSVFSQNARMAKEEKSAFEKAEMLLYETGAWDVYFNILYPLYVRMRLENYAPYWVSHCKWDAKEGAWINPRDQRFLWRKDVGGWFIAGSTPECWSLSTDIPPILEKAGLSLERELLNVSSNAEGSREYEARQKQKFAAEINAA